MKVYASTCGVTNSGEEEQPIVYVIRRLFSPPFITYTLSSVALLCEWCWGIVTSACGGDE